MNNSPQRAAKGFTRAFWVSNTVELFERMAYYAVFIVLTIYLSSILGFNDFEASMISGLFSGGLYLLPIFSGAYADKIGFRKSMIIAVDFDGTIVEHRYPRIGEEIPFAVDTLKLLQQEKHRLILWSVREGALLDEAVEWCKARGLEFYAVNKDYPEEQKGHQGFSRKLKADMFIDDRNLGGLPDWGVIYEMIKEKKTFTDIYSQNGEEEKTSLKKKKRWLPF